jgi:5-methylcytosine-specific restriction endonuclease McrA
MSNHRRPEIRFSDAPRGECRWCGDAILYLEGSKQGEVDRRRRWHPECVDIYNASDPREARRTVRKRDRGVCAECRLDTNALRRQVKGRGRTKALREKGFVPRRSLWELDHIIPLIDGGGHDLENLQTLCTPCHKKKTAEEASHRAVLGQPPTDDSPHRSAPPKRAARGADLDTLLARAGEVNERAESALRRVGAGRSRR